MAGPGDLYLLAQEYLDACSEALETIPSYEPHLSGAPVRQFVSPGTPVWDCCDQLAVYVTPIVEADTSPGPLSSSKRMGPLARINHVLLSAGITRCIPGGLEPPVAELNAASEQLLADAWALWNHLANMRRSGAFLTLCQEAFFEGIVAAPSSGACGGWVANMRVQLDGYLEELGS